MRINAHNWCCRRGFDEPRSEKLVKLRALLCFYDQLFLRLREVKAHSAQVVRRISVFKRRVVLTFRVFQGVSLIIIDRFKYAFHHWLVSWLDCLSDNIHADLDVDKIPLFTEPDFRNLRWTTDSDLVWASELGGSDSPHGRPVQFMLWHVNSSHKYWLLNV